MFLSDSTVFCCFLSKLPMLGNTPGRPYSTPPASVNDTAKKFGSGNGLGNVHADHFLSADVDDLWKK